MIDAEIPGELPLSQLTLQVRRESKIFIFLAKAWAEACRVDVGKIPVRENIGRVEDA